MGGVGKVLLSGGNLGASSFCYSPVVSTGSLQTDLIWAESLKIGCQACGAHLRLLSSNSPNQHITMQITSPTNALTVVLSTCYFVSVSSDHHQKVEEEFVEALFWGQSHMSRLAFASLCLRKMAVNNSADLLPAWTVGQGCSLVWLMAEEEPPKSPAEQRPSRAVKRNLCRADNGTLTS